MSRTYITTLRCGCMISEDRQGLIPCYAEYGDMRKTKDRKRLRIHKECMEEFKNDKV